MIYNKEEQQALALAEQQAAELFNKLKQSKAKSKVSLQAGTILTLKDGLAEVIEYRDCHNVTIKFLATGTIVTARADNLIRNKVKDKFSPSVYGLGFLGDTESYDALGKQKDSYFTWSRALARVATRPDYKDVSVAEDFRCFEHFEIWYNNLVQPFLAAGVTPELEKDLASLLDGKPKAYSLERCYLAPREVNQYVKNLERQLKQIDTSAADQLVPGISLETDRQLLRVSFRSADSSLKHYGWFKLDQLQLAKNCLRKARIEDFKERAKPFFYLLPAHVVESIKSM